MKLLNKAIDEIYDLSYYVIRWSLPLCVIYIVALYILFTFPLIVAIEKGFYTWASLMIASVILHLAAFYVRCKRKTQYIESSSDGSIILTKGIKMELIFMAIAVWFNIVFIKWKFEKERYLDAIFDLSLMLGVMFLFNGTYSALVVGTIASALISIHLFFFPPKFNFI